ncbi:MAG TPA: SGNH/GDSL hydrolase family protein [Chthoniobacterales bacterium]
MITASPPERILVYGDSNSWGWIPVAHGRPSSRYPTQERWPDVMAATLGSGHEVITEALNGRTTDVADPDERVPGAGLDGSQYLAPCLASHLPLDLIIIMLGTNDLKAKYQRSALRIGLGAAKLLDLVQSCQGGVGTAYPNPRALLVCPAPLGPTEIVFGEDFAGGQAKSAALPAIYAQVAGLAGAAFFDVGTVTGTDGVDGVHLSAEAHHRLGQALAAKVKAVMAAR